ncbi:Adaptive-response sensory-kinase SasA [Emticicia aquatica]|uniref:histidine kinase n=1 Tax=Emticicia aquatica TaxID=1681835 RepID=A0ABM9APJ6_9BACT|nr:tetratricopeptide repeat-containing sensor histidine kinase [Emticicia aquatica]CAH0995710.1 Adaptive-response sensory-kinase SasA [Emticicia aquatica]
MKTLIKVALLLIVQLSTFAQKTAEQINKLCLQVIQYDESQLDSMRFYANQIEKDSRAINYTLGICYGYRLRGLANELEGKFQEASKDYIYGLKISEEKKDLEAKLLMLSDLGSLKVSTKQYDKAKGYFSEALIIAQSLIPKPKPKRLSSFYQNLGICYRNLHQIDSALINYKKSLEIKKQIGDSAGIANLGINLSALLVNQKKYQEAKTYLDFNIAYHTKVNAVDDLWNDYLNLAGIYIPLKQYEKAKKLIDNALIIAQKLKSKSKIADTYRDYSTYYQEINDYKNAYEYVQKYHSLENELLNTETNNAISELEEKYQSEKKTQENKLLNTELQTQKQQKLIWIILSLAIGLFGFTVAYSWWQNRKKNIILTQQNDFIQSQNKKLAELNQEKNHLISVVSHDLGSPFSTIKLWGSILFKNPNLDDDAKEATENINKMATYGQNMVKKILQIEKAETNEHTLNLTEIELVGFTNTILEGFKPALDGKEISINFEASKPQISVLSDTFYLNRILENVISNALKYSYRNSEVSISINEGKEDVCISVKDYGVGIDEEGKKNLFSKFSQISSKPTENEDSMGLGLHIVKRLVDELGGNITCESEVNKGSTFTVFLKK